MGADLYVMKSQKDYRRSRSASLPPSLSYYAKGEPYEYAPLPGPRMIRLLYIQHCDINLESYFVRGRLEVVNIDDVDNKYVALSYTWGPPLVENFADLDLAPYELLIESDEGSRRLADDGTVHDASGRAASFPRRYTTMELSANLSDYLHWHAQWHADSRAPVWIDAVCINQRDPAEVSRQLLLQGEIYSLASRTNIWLGAYALDLGVYGWWVDTVRPAVLRARDAHDRGPSTTRYYDEIGGRHPLDAQFWLDEFGLEPFPGRDWYQSMVVYYRFISVRRWFSRVWVVQEALLARECVMLCTDRAFRWRDVLDLDEVMCLDSWCRKLIERARERGDYFSDDWSPYYVFDRIPAAIDRAQDQSAKHGDFHILLECVLEILQRTRPLAATIARDKVLGLLGIIRNVLPEDHRISSLAHETSRDSRETFIAFAKYCIGKGSLHILNFVQDPALTATANLPTWVPDWGFSQQLFVFRAVNGLRAGTSSNLTNNPGLCPRVDGETLVVHGKRLGKVTNVYGGDAWVKNIDQLLGLLGPMYAFNGESISEALFRTLLYDRSIKDLTKPFGVDDHILVLEYLRWVLIKVCSEDDGLKARLNKFVLERVALEKAQDRALVETIQDALDWLESKNLKSISDVDGGIDCERTTEGDVSDARLPRLSQLGETCYSRLERLETSWSLFTTDTVSLGLGRKMAQPEDELWVVVGSDLITILRPTADGVGYSLVGTSVVCGFMEGQALRGITESELNEIRVI